MSNPFFDTDSDSSDSDFDFPSSIANFSFDHNSSTGTGTLKIYPQITHLLTNIEVAGHIRVNSRHDIILKIVFEKRYKTGGERDYQKCYVTLNAGLWEVDEEELVEAVDEGGIVCVVRFEGDEGASGGVQVVKEGDLKFSRTSPFRSSLF